MSNLSKRRKLHSQSKIKQKVANYQLFPHRHLKINQIFRRLKINQKRNQKGAAYQDVLIRCLKIK